MTLYPPDLLTTKRWLRRQLRDARECPLPAPWPPAEPPDWACELSKLRAWL